MTDSGDLRGSAPIYSAKEILVSLDAKVDRIGENVAILVNENLPSRMVEVERFKERLIGVATIGAVLGAVGTIISIATMIAAGK